ncbi:MAG: L,D-transpeptidase [Thainema sp.]
MLYRYRSLHRIVQIGSALLMAGAVNLVSLPPVTLPAAAQTTAIATRMNELQQSQQRWIQIDTTRQRLIAWEGNTPIYAVIVSTGKPSTPTPTGVFAIQSKHRTARMQGADYDIPDVPFTMYYSGNYGIHGAYWHHRFGTPISHGCTNVAVDHAEWLFNWASVGTPVIVTN